MSAPGIGTDPDAAVPAHRGDFLAEQRAMTRSAAVVDRSHRGVLAVPGDDRLRWLHPLLTQHVAELPEGTGTQALVLDLNRRVLHHAVLAHVGDTVWLDTEPGDAPVLLDYLEKMRFWPKVEPRDATAELAVVSVGGADPPTVLARAGGPVPDGAYASVPLPGGGLVRRMPWPGADAADLLVPREASDTWQERLVAARARAAGAEAFEAVRGGGPRPRRPPDTHDPPSPPQG